MKRSATWRTDLTAYMREVSHRPFIWSQHDCALFAAGAVHAMTGEDFGAPYRGKYKTLRGGLRLLKRKGFANHAELAASLFDEVHPSRANVGDLAVVQEDGHVALGVVQGPRVYVLRPGEVGVGTVDLLTASRAFRVPFTETRVE